MNGTSSTHGVDDLLLANSGTLENADSARQHGLGSASVNLALQKETRTEDDIDLHAQGEDDKRDFTANEYQCHSSNVKVSQLWLYVGPLVHGHCSATHVPTT